MFVFELPPQFDSMCRQDRTFLAVAAIKQTAREAYELSLSNHDKSFKRIRDSIQANPYWPEFCKIAQRNSIPNDWLSPVHLGGVILRWAKHKPTNAIGESTHDDLREKSSNQSKQRGIPR